MENVLKKQVKKFTNMSIGAKITLSLFFVFFVVEAVIQLYPFLWGINNSLKDTREFYESSLALTKSWRFSNYADVFTKFKVKGGVGYLTMLWNSVWQTAMYLFVNILSSTLVAYAVSKFRFPGRKFLYGLMIFTQTIPIIGTGAASYKLRYAMGMINNPALIWFYWAMGFDYACFVLYGTFQGISNSYSESAEIDGANEWQILLRVVLPQAFPAIVALLITNFVARWNDYAQAQISLNNFPNLAYGLYLFQKTSQYESNSQGLYYAALVFTALPGVLLYVFFQNFVVKNVSIGGIKG